MISVLISEKYETVAKIHDVSMQTLLPPVAASLATLCWLRDTIAVEIWSVPVAAALRIWLPLRPSNTLAEVTKSRRSQRASRYVWCATLWFSSDEVQVL